jgi:hypothetical protein
VVAGLAALITIAAATPVLYVDVASDLRLPCAAHAALALALRERVPGLRVDEGVRAEGGDLLARLQRGPEAWELELRKSGGELLLRRRLAVDGSDCALLGASAALVVDRYLEAVHWAGRPVSLPGLAKAPEPDAGPPAAEAATGPTDGSSSAAEVSAPQAGSMQVAVGPPLVSEPQRAEASRAAPPPLPPTPLPTPRVAPPATAAPAPAPEPQPLPPPPLTTVVTVAPPEPERRGGPERRLQLSAGPALLLAVAGDLLPALELEASWRQAPPLRFGLTLQAAGSSTAPVNIGGDQRGQTSLQQQSLLGAVALCGERLGLGLCGGLLAGARFTSGSSTGARLFLQRSALIAQPALGAAFDLSLPLVFHLDVSLAVRAAAPLGSAALAVSGGPSRSLSPLDLSVALRLGWAVY